MLFIYTIETYILWSWCLLCIRPILSLLDHIMTQSQPNYIVQKQKIHNLKYLVFG